MFLTPLAPVHSRTERSSQRNRTALIRFEQAGVLGDERVNLILGQSAAVITLHEWSQAASLAQEALEAAPDDARQHNNLGLIASGMGDLDAARQYFEQPASLAPDWDLARQNLADLQSS